MLDESLENFLEATLSGERYKLYVEVISYLESIEYSTIQDELLNLAFSSISDGDEKQQKPESLICDEMHAHLIQVLVSQLRLSGVTIMEETTLHDTFELAVGIVHIGGHEDVASILATAGNDEGPIDQLAEILHLVTTVPTEHWLVMLDEVSPQLIQRIVELANRTVDAEYQEMEETAEYLQKLRIYSEFAQAASRELKCFDLVETNMLGRDFVFYINSGTINELFEGNEMERLAMELFGLALMSADAKDDPPAAVRLIIEQYLSDTTRIVKLNNEITKVNAAFVKFFQTISKGLTS
ncbi:MAG TPA: hypothetical protein VF905_09420 [Nitrospirota bacterium]